MKSDPRESPPKNWNNMTERDILARQEQAGNREFFLMLVGSFVHAYGHGAFALGDHGTVL